MTFRMSIVLLFALTCLSPLYARATELININTADTALLDTLPGIGPSKAAAIIEYRTQHGSFARIEDIQDVSGIGPSTYADIAPLITVGGGAPPPNQPNSPVSVPDTASSNTSTATVSTATAGVGSASPEYIPIPTLRITTDGDRTVSSGADTAFTAVVYDGKGNRRDDALVTWTFGDGMQRTGASVFHRYYHSGAYLVVAKAITSDGGEARKEIRLTAENPNIRIVSVSTQGIALANDDTRVLNISLWRLSAGGKEFKLPEGTQILPGSSVVFPPQVTGLSVAGVAALLYPSGETAATYPPQPSILAQGYKQVQEVEPLAASKVEPIISKKANVQAYEKAVIAPAEATKLASAGAALPSVGTASSAPVRASGLFSSSWTLSFIGVIALAGAAFIFI